MALTLTKMIPARPARQKTLTAEWCQADFSVMSEVWRRVRAKSRNPMEHCFWCQYAFQDGDTIGLACFVKVKGNKVLCSKCCDQLSQSEKE